MVIWARFSSAACRDGPGTWSPALSLLHPGLWAHPACSHPSVWRELLVGACSAVSGCSLLSGCAHDDSLETDDRTAIVPESVCLSPSLFLWDRVFPKLVLNSQTLSHPSECWDYSVVCAPAPGYVCLMGLL